MISRMAFVRAIPGTSTISVPMVTASELIPRPSRASSMASPAAKAAQTAV